RSSVVIFAGLAVLVLAGRIYYCFQLPLYTTDLLRNLGYGKAFWDYGFALYDMTAFDLSPWPCQFLWHNYHYTYPPLTLLLFGLIAALHTSMVWGKIVLTIFDALSAWIIGRASGDRWLGLLYWINPISIWYTSREGQFEGYVVFWTVLAVWALQRRKPWAYGLLGAAVQAKFFPLFLGPLFLARMSWKAPARLAREWAWGLAAFLPSLAAFLWGGYPEHLMEKNYVPPVNPISWSIGEPGVYQHFPVWLISSHWVVSVGFLLFCLYGMRRTQQVLPWIAPVVFVVLVRLSQMAQFWYFMLLPAFCLPVEDVKLRRILFVWCAAFGLLSLHSIFIGPTGYLNPPDAVVILQKAFWGF
ncbi:MAG: glycosyltransferase family 87 protein, partial [Candidatus Hinthialibacter sp.]